MAVDLTTSTLTVIAVLTVAVLIVMGYRPVRAGMRRAAARRASLAALRVSTSLRCSGVHLIDDLTLAA